MYAVGAVATFVTTAVFILRGVKVDRNEFDYQEPGYCEPLENKWIVYVVVIAMSALMAVFWIGLPVVLGGVFVLDWIQEKHPHIMGGLNDTKED